MASAKNGYLKIVQKGDPLYRQGFKSLKGAYATLLPLPPKSAGETAYVYTGADLGFSRGGGADFLKMF